MSQVNFLNNVLTSEEIEDILSLPEVLKAKDSIDSKESGSVYFNIPLTKSLKNTLKEKFGLELSNLKNIPMRWIKGDTHPHIDRGVNNFENTYLAYLTNSSGEFIVDNNSYPISQGCGFVFQEGLRHETVNTGSEPRLLLGPMSEKAFAVGGPAPTSPNDTIFISSNGTGGWKTTINGVDNDEGTNSITVTNSDPTSGILKVLFSENMTISNTNMYIVCGSDGIQIGSTSLNDDGTRRTLNVTVAGYPGLVRNGVAGGSPAAKSKIYIFNLKITTSGSGSLANSGGWIGQRYFGNGGTNNYIVNCHTTGNIPQYSGGIVGDNAAATSGSVLTVDSCSSIGDISGGGIYGTNAGNNNGNAIAKSCWSYGTIRTNCGGIFGTNAANALGNSSAESCWSYGSIANNGGGIYGLDAADSSGSVNITNCYSTGSIGQFAGGIVGFSSGPGQKLFTVSNCFSTGNIDASGGGIMGAAVGSAVVTNCYTTGTVTNSRGYIIGGIGLTGGNVNNGSSIISCYAGAKDSITGFKTATAVTTLLDASNNGIGAKWVFNGTNTPYLIHDMGYTPYSLEVIEAPTATNSFTPSVIRSFSPPSLGARNTTLPAIVNSLAYGILYKELGDSNVYDSITIDSVSGSIVTTPASTVATYKLWIRNNIDTNSYTLSTVYLNVNKYYLNLLHKHDSDFRWNREVSWTNYRNWWRNWVNYLEE